MRLGMLCPRRPLARPASLPGLAAPLVENGLDARDVAAHLANPRGMFELPAGALEAQVENLLAQRVDLLAQFVVGAGSDIGCLHSLHGGVPSPSRVTNLVPIGSFAAASSKASRATSGGTPSSSNMMR